MERGLRFRFEPDWKHQIKEFFSFYRPDDAGRQAAFQLQYHFVLWASPQSVQKITVVEADFNFFWAVRDGTFVVSSAQRCDTGNF